MENVSVVQIAEYRRNKLYIVIASVILYAIYDFVTQLMQGRQAAEQIITFVTTIAFGFLILLWCSFDSAERDEQLGTGWTISIVVFGVFALIVYLFKTRGLKNGFKSFGWLLLFFAVFDSCRNF